VFFGFFVTLITTHTASSPSFPSGSPRPTRSSLLKIGLLDSLTGYAPEFGIDIQVAFREHGTAFRGEQASCALMACCLV
jgi:hypothetical protein